MYVLSFIKYFVWAACQQHQYVAGGLREPALIYWGFSKDVAFAASQIPEIFAGALRAPAWIHYGSPIGNVADAGFWLGFTKQYPWGILQALTFWLRITKGS